MDRPVVPLPLAVVGTGRMGTVHARLLADHPSVELVAIVEPAVERGQALASELGVRHFAEATDLFEEELAAGVLIAAPTPTHPALVRQALEAGLPVLCEKPLALDPEDGEELAALAADGGLVQVGFWRRFSPPWVAAREAIDSGAIGRPLMVRLSQWDAAPPPAEFCDPAVSGGLAIDCGVHEFDLAEWLTGERVERVIAWNLPIVDASVEVAGDVDNLVAVLDLSGGAVATVDLSRNSGYADDVRTEVLGEEGAVFIDLLPTGRARLGTSSGVADIPGSDAGDAMEAGLSAQVAAFARAVAGDDLDIPGPDDSNRAVAIGRAVQRAAATGEAEVVPG